MRSIAEDDLLMGHEYVHAQSRAVRTLGSIGRARIFIGWVWRGTIVSARIASRRERQREMD